MNRVQVVTLSALVAAVGLTGCSAAQPLPTPTTTPTVRASAPADGITLRDMGLRNGPTGFNVPRGLSVKQVVDQPNVVTLVTSGPQAETMAAYLRDHLPAMGFTITGDADGSLVFHNSEWEGALTSANDLVGLTLRRQT